MNDPLAQAPPRRPTASEEGRDDPSDGDLAAWRGALVEAQARRIRDLEQTLAERTRVLTDAAHALAAEIRRRQSAQAALAEAQRLEAVGHMAGGMVHDLRNVLGALGVGYQVCKLKTADPELHRVADSGIRALAQANGLMESLLGLMRRQEDGPARIESGDWLAQMSDLLGYAAGHGKTCRIEVAPNAWPVRAVEHRLGAALVNLTANARDAMPAGGEIVVAVANLPKGGERPKEIPDGDCVVFSVTDTGCGMTSDVLARATEALFSTKPRGQGTGLGLAMVRDFARASGGHLHIASAPGYGTLAELYLPRSDYPQTQAAESGSPDQSLRSPIPSGAAAEPGLAGRLPGRPAGTLMVVDADDLARAGLAASLREMGWEVMESTGAEIALALLHTRTRLDGVLADLDLPGSDGVMLARRLRLERPSLPVLLVTARSLLMGASLAGVRVLAKALDPMALDLALRREIARADSSGEERDALLDRLLVRMRSPVLLVALLGWREARGNAKLPDLGALQRAVPDIEENTFLAEPEGPADSPFFRVLRVGSVLTRKLGRSLDGATPGAPGEGTLDGLAVAYRRASRAGLPSYDYARYSLDDGPPIHFERLILPASRDAETVSHLLGIVLFGHLPDAPSTVPDADKREQNP